MRTALTFCLILLGSATALAAEPPNVFIRYSFDDGLTDTGPDTFAVFQNASGHVRLVSQIHYGGYRSIELRDVAGDGDFPELQGYFPLRKQGELFFHFAFLVVNPSEGFNVALAGPSHFTLAKDGIAFWLKARDGVLHHVSDSIPKRLFALEPFTWYLVGVRYDVHAGRYDLGIRRERDATPFVELRDQPNATNAPDSSVDKFSFVGSVHEDDSNVTFYVDEVALGTDEKLVPGPLVAPGRRKLFVDRWREAQELFAKSPSCPPVLGLDDFGLHDGDLAMLNDSGELELLRQLLYGSPSGPPRDVPGALEPVAVWRSGCARMESDARGGAESFARGAARFPSAPIFAISEILALVRAGEYDAAGLRWAELEPRLGRDARYGMLAAILGKASGDLAAAERWLVQPAEEIASDFGRPEVRRFWNEGGADATSDLRRLRPDAWEAQLEQKLITSQYYFVLLWQGEHRRAARFAGRMAQRLETLGADFTGWLERRGDALLLAGATAEARIAYEKVLERDASSWGATTKLSDVFFLLGDPAREKEYRERIYGSLRE